MAYRDASLEQRRSRIAFRREEALHKRRAISPISWALLPEELAAIIRPLHELAQIDIANAPEDELNAFESKLDAVCTGLEQAEARAPDFRRCSNELPMPPKPTMPQPWLMEEISHKALRNRIDLQLAKYGDARAERWGDYTYTARMELEESSARLTVFLEVWDTAILYRCSLRATVPPGVMPLYAVVEGVTDRTLEALGLREELSSGNSAFDRTFWITGHERSLALLNRAAQGYLVEVATHVDVTLDIDDSLLSLRWTTPTEPLPECAVAFVREVRRTIASG